MQVKLLHENDWQQATWAASKLREHWQATQLFVAARVRRKKRPLGCG
jgi:hypothetical protein